MKLTQYLTDNGISETAFAERIGCGQATINRYINGKRFPEREMILKIEEATDGAVSPADWYAPAVAAE